MKHIYLQLVGDQTKCCKHSDIFIEYPKKHWGLRIVIHKKVWQSQINAFPLLSVRRLEQEAHPVEKILGPVI